MINIDDLGSISNEYADNQGKSMGEAVVNNLLAIRDKIVSKAKTNAIKSGADDVDANGENYP
jgi:hypothetical protein